MTVVAKPMIDSPLSSSMVALKDELEIEDTELLEVDWAGRVATSISVNTVVIIKSDFTAAKLPNTTFMDVRLEKCQLAGTVIEGGGLNRVEIISAQASGLTITQSRLKDVLFKDCHLNLANFRFTNFKNVIFENCILTEADFAYSQMDQVSFQNCQLNDTEFSGVKFQKVDLRTSSIEKIKGVAYLKGVTIDNLQLITLAPLLAQELGLKVLE
jgi:uncharacterized protein YjbI with pentapeptide repeats